MESQLKSFKTTKAKELKAFLKELDAATPKVTCPRPDEPTTS